METRVEGQRKSGGRARRRGWASRVIGDVVFVVRRDRKWWLVPLIVIVLMLVSLLLFALLAGPLAPFIYPVL